MNKTAIKNYAISARVQLIEAVRQKAFEYEITEDGENKPDLDAINGRVLTAPESEQRNQLIEQIRQKGYAQVMEEAAYTWFNRFIALRFMEVNGYLPSKTRVFTDENNAFKPEILKQAMTVELDGLDRERVFDLLDKQNNEELYKYLLLTQCNALNAALPDMFETIGSWTELLFPANLLKADSVIDRMIREIPEDNWTDQVEIIGWLYQYYNTEPKDKVFARPSGQKIKKEDVPAATQLFTPDWIVRYMVENSLGRILVDSDEWLVGSERIERQKEIAAQMGWKYFLPEAEQSPEVYEQLKNLTTTHHPLTTTFLDPCMGSGHILVYAFDVFMDIYTAQGYTERDAAQLIVEKNLYGLELDDRAAQLAYFAVMMKARSYDRRFLTRGIKPNLCSIQESNSLNTDYLELFGDLKPTAQKLVDEFIDAKEYGSILNLRITADEIEQLESKFAEIDETVYDNFFDSARQAGLRTAFASLLKQAKIMAKKYEIVCTNPPYMGGGGMSPKLNDYVKLQYSDSKADLFSVFIEKGNNWTVSDGYNSMVTMQSWMFLTSFEKMRKSILSTKTITSLIHMENMVMGIAFGTAVTVIKNCRISQYKGIYTQVALKDIKNGKPSVFPNISNRYAEISSDEFSKIPSSPIAYWASAQNIKAYETYKPIDYYADLKKGMSTADDKRFLRLWFEVSSAKTQMFCDFEKAKWFHINKGGSFCRWFGNNEYVVNWERNGLEMKAFKKSVIRNEQYYFRDNALTWTYVTNYKLNARYVYKSTFAAVGPCIFANDENKYYILSLLNSKVAQLYADNVGGETITYEIGEISKIPCNIDSLVKDGVISTTIINIELCKKFWDSFETSWDFKIHPLIQYKVPQTEFVGNIETYLISDAFDMWATNAQAQFDVLKANEEELNRIFIEIYGLQDELTPEVEDRDVTVRKADLQREIKSLISYAVGCMFGRYSVNEEGLQFAGGSFSDEWVVVSGQYFSRKVVEYYVSQELSRVDRLAEIYGFSDRDLSTGEAAPEGGNVWLIRPDEEGGGVDPFQYRRGTSKKLYEGIHPVSFHSKGIEIGAGNTAFDLCSPEILDAITNRNGDELIKRGWQDAERVDWETINYSLTTNHLSPDLDNIIPICDDEYFDDDIVGLFVDFVRKVYGEETLEENLRFIADALGGKGTPREIIRRYFLNDFYKDHCKIYQKRPIYWLFSSGKKNGFKALIYLHRYQPDLLARIRTDYVHEQQERYRTQLKMLEDAFEKAAASERVKLNKQIRKLKEQSLEIRQYEEKIHHLADRMIPLDLDDGVKVNYEKFAGVVEKIR